LLKRPTEHLRRLRQQPASKKTGVRYIKQYWFGGVVQRLRRRYEGTDYIYIGVFVQDKLLSKYLH